MLFDYVVVVIRETSCQLDFARSLRPIPDAHEYDDVVDVLQDHA